MEFIKNLYKQVRSFFARIINVMDQASHEAIDEAYRTKTVTSYIKAGAIVIADFVVCGLFGRLVGFVLGTVFCGLFGAAGVLIALPLAIWFILDTFAEARKIRTDKFVADFQARHAAA